MVQKHHITRFESDVYIISESPGVYMWVHGV